MYYSLLQTREMFKSFLNTTHCLSNLHTSLKMPLFSSLIPPFHHLKPLLIKHLYSTTKTPTTLSKIPTKHRQKAIKKAQEILTDYLHTTRSLPFTYAESISKYSLHNLSEQIISKVKFSPINFDKNMLKFLRYNPINEFGFFYESIGVNYVDIDRFLKPNVYFFCDDLIVLDVACTLAGLGFPWNKLGKLLLCVEKVSIFEKKPEFLSSKFNDLLKIGFSNEQAVGVCLGFPCLLDGDFVGLSCEFDDLLDDLKRVFVDFDLASCTNNNNNSNSNSNNNNNNNSVLSHRCRVDLGGYVVGNVDAWYDVCRKIKFFYDLGVKKGKIGESICRSYSIFFEFSEKVLEEKEEFLCKFDIGKVDVGLMLLSNPEIMSINLDNLLSVEGFLNYFGLLKEEVETLMKKYPYVFGRNKMCNLPHILKAVDLHQWFLDELKRGKCNLLANYTLSNPDDGKDEDYVQKLEKCKGVRTYGYSLSKLDFFHGIGFGENVYTAKLLVVVHGSASGLQERFDYLLNKGIEFSKICKMIVHTPKFLNQELDCLKLKIDFLIEEVGLSLDYLVNHPAYLIYNLENRIKRRYNFHVWLTKQGLCTRNYSLLGIVAVSHKSFMAQLACIHPKAPQLWLEQIGQKK